MPKRDTLADEPFDYRATRSGLVQIFHRGTLVTTLAGNDANRFLLKVKTADSRETQLAMARATGHFKHGNEHSSRS